jgi:hypothetical protein
MRMGVAVVALLLALFSASPAAGGSRPSFAGTSMTVAASPHAARAHGVRLTVTLRYLMQCGYAGAGPLVVTFPSALKLPSQFASGSVKLAAKPVPARLNGHQVTVAVPPPDGVLCNTMAPGSVKLVFTRKARLANPTRAGSYPFSATHGPHSFTAKLAIKHAG